MQTEGPPILPLPPESDHVGRQLPGRELAFDQSVDEIFAIAQAVLAAPAREDTTAKDRLVAGWAAARMPELRAAAAAGALPICAADAPKLACIFAAAVLAVGRREARLVCNPDPKPERRD